MTTDQGAIEWWGAITDPTYQTDPYPLLREMRERGPIHFNEMCGSHFVVSHEVFTRISRSKSFGNDPRLLKNPYDSSEARKKDPLTYNLFHAFQPQMLNVNAPDHRRMRGVYERFFTPTAAARRESLIREATLSLLDKMPDEGEIDLMSTFAQHLPFRIIMSMFEIPVSHYETIASWGEPIIFLSEFIMSPEEKQEAVTALTDFKALLRDFIEHRRAHPGDGAIDAVIAAGPPDGPLNDEESVTNLLTILVSGYKTSVSFMGNSVYALVTNPDQMARLRKDRGLMKNAVEEVMRYEPGACIIPRIVNEDIQIEDKLFPKGSACFGMVCALNRDPAVFQDPDRMDIARNPNPHMTFGGGAHHCLGAPLARLEGQIAFGMLLDRFSRIELADEPKWIPNRITNHCLERLPLHVKRS